MRQYMKTFSVLVAGLIVTGVFGQEYDDLYFTKKDREKQNVSQNTTYNASYSQNQNYSYVEPAQTEPQSFLGKQFEYNAQDVGVSQESLDYYAPEKTQEDYAVTYTESAYINGTERNPNFSNPVATYEANPQQPVVVNNYYNNGLNHWNNRPGWNIGFGWNNWGGNFWSLSYGNGWGGGWYDPFWCPPGAGRPVYVVGEYSRRRAIVRNARPVRGSATVRQSRSSSGRRVIATDASSRARYNRQQSDNLNRSRSSRYSRSSDQAVNNTLRTSRSGTNQRSSVRSASRSRSTNNGNYSRSTTSRSRTYTAPSSSRGSSRSSYSSGRSSSRSSGSVSRSRSSSSRSSGSRSSSSSSRSRSGSRRGN